MKSYGNLFHRVASFENLLLAWRKARRSKRDKAEVFRFEYDLEHELLGLERSLRAGSWRPGPYRSFYIYEPKKRLISAAPFRDRVVHHAICNVIEPLFEERFIHDTYSCRHGKGQHGALDRFTRFARRYPYVLKADVMKYFPSIDHEILLGIIEHRVRDARLMDLIRRIVQSGSGLDAPETTPACFPGDDLFSTFRTRGLPIGNLTSQLFANIYLDPLDHFVKEDLGIKGYVRYCDDFVLFDESRTALSRLADTIRTFVVSLRLRLHDRKTVVYRVDRGVPFLGFVVFPDHRRLLRRSVLRARRRFRHMTKAYAHREIGPAEVRASLAAWSGHVRHGDTWRLTRSMLSRFRLVRAAR